MHLNGTAVRARHQLGPVSPVISGEDGWLGNDDWDQPLTLQLRLPVSAEEMAAALYGERLSADDLATDENVWGFAALAIVQHGLTAIQRRADETLAGEARGRLANPGWLELCRRRVAEVTGAAATGPTTLFSFAATTTARAGAQPPSTTSFPGPRALEEEKTAPPEPGTRAGGLAYVRALTEVAAPCRAGN